MLREADTGISFLFIPLHSIVILTHTLLPDSPPQSFGSEYGGSSRAEGKSLALSLAPNDLCHHKTGSINGDDVKLLMQTPVFWLL